MVILAAISVLAWLALLFARGGFWRADQQLPLREMEGQNWPAVAVLIPARNEEQTVARVLESHVASAYPGPLTIVLIDDGSTDGTSEIAHQVALKAALNAARQIEVLTAPALPDGWTGKLWALETGYRALDRLAPQAGLVLLSDADIFHAPETLAKLVSHLGPREMVSLMARLDMRGIWGGLLMPAFVFFFQKLYPFSIVNDPSRSLAAAAGGCVLIRREALQSIGGFSAIRKALIDDCALAGAVKGQGGAIWLGLASDEVVSLRDNRRFGSIWRMVTRTAFTQLGHSTGMLAGAIVGMALVYLAGPAVALGFAWHDDQLAATLGAVAWGLAGFAYLPTVRFYGLAAWRAFTLPVAALIYMAMTLGSAVSYWRGRGGFWKGRSY